MDMYRITRGMNTKTIMITATVLMIGRVAWPAVVVQELPTVEQPMHSISDGDFRSGRIGALPPGPWLSSKSTERCRVTVETPAGRPESERWVRLVDDSDKESANIRQSFGPVTSGVFQVQLISNRDGGRLLFNLGQGAASKPEERALQLCIESDGSLVVRGERKSRTVTRIRTGEVYLVRCDFERAKDGNALRVRAALVDEGAQRESHVETEVMTTLAISAVRITSTMADTGVDYSVTDVSLTSR